MNGRRWLNQPLAWLALAAMSFGAVAPTLSQLLTSTGRVAWVEVCTLAGVQRVLLELPAAPVPHAPRGDDSHCGYCLLQQHSPSIASAPPGWLAFAAGDVDPIGQLSDLPVYPRLERGANRSRAPPPLS